MWEKKSLERGFRCSPWLELTTRDRVLYTLQIKIREVNLLFFFFNIELLSIECILDIPFRITYHWLAFLQRKILFKITKFRNYSKIFRKLNIKEKNARILLFSYNFDKLEYCLKKIEIYFALNDDIYQLFSHLCLLFINASLLPSIDTNN